MSICLVAWRKSGFGYSVCIAELLVGILVDSTGKYCGEKQLICLNLNDYLSIMFLKNGSIEL